MDTSKLADTIVIIAALSWVIRQFADVIAEIALTIQAKRRRRSRRRQHDRFVAARVAARKDYEKRLRAEGGMWSNYELQLAMDEAGRMAAPGYRP